jgi:hypothetical protein
MGKKYWFRYSDETTVTREFPDTAEGRKTLSWFAHNEGDHLLAYGKVADRCCECKHWGDGDGGGIPYDAGNVNICNHPQITGDHHCSKGACGEPDSKVIVEGQIRQRIWTRFNFGCNQIKSRL